MKKGINALCYTIFDFYFFRKRVTFLYKLTRGISPKSYGIHVAHMAGIPSAVIEYADKCSNLANVGTGVMSPE